MKTSEFKYNLPEDLIAKYPPQKRGDARLMVLDRKNKTITHKKYKDVVDYMEPGDTIVLNRTKVEKVRVFGKVRRNDREVELLFINNVQHENPEIGYEYWYALIGRAKYTQNSDIIDISENYCVQIVEQDSKDIGFIIKLKIGDSDKIFKEFGHVPIPPYMKRSDDASDYIRYNTVFGNKTGSVAAPTASLNITPELLDKIASKGCKIAYVELNVGWGTFAPVRTENIEDFKIHGEFVSVPKETVDTVNETILSGGQIWSFGTTATRALETAAIEDGKGGFRLSEFSGITNIYIYPGYKWKIVNRLITNFHASQSSLVVLVSSFAGYDFTMQAYSEAIKEKYRFLSYGDSMLII